MRCFALIEQLVKLNVNVVVVACQLTDFVKNKLQNLSVVNYSNNVKIGSMDDLNELVSYVKKHNAVTLVIDGYQFDVNYRQQLKANLENIVVFDDINELESLYCDVVINALPSAKLLTYEKSAPVAKYLLGAKFSILRAEFLALTLSSFDQRNSLLINFGGSDVAQLTLPIIKLLVDGDFISNKEKVIVVTGSGCGQYDEIAQACSTAGFEHHHDSHNIANLLNQSSLALCAPGSIIYELAYCQVPSIFLTVAENQMLSAKAQQKIGWCHVFNGLKSEQLQDAVNTAKALWQDKDKRKKMAVIASEQVDGDGVKRICQQLLKLGVGLT
jgi:UDP-2,4-diacetamido-2,4,6-trideoxy-beta-L-altropyranose hydrolase